METEMEKKTGSPDVEGPLWRYYGLLKRVRRVLWWKSLGDVLDVVHDLWMRKVPWRVVEAEALGVEKRKYREFLKRFSRDDIRRLSFLHARQGVDVSSLPSPPATAYARETWEKLGRELDPILWATLRMYAEGGTPEEIADRLGVRRQTVCRRLVKAVEEARKLVGVKEGEESCV